MRTIREIHGGIDERNTIGKIVMNKPVVFQQRAIFILGIVAVCTGKPIQKPVQSSRPWSHKGVQAGIHVYPTFGHRKTTTKVDFNQSTLIERNRLGTLSAFGVTDRDSGSLDQPTGHGHGLSLAFCRYMTGMPFLRGYWVLQ